MAHRYDDTFEPPAPVLPLVLRAVDGDAAVTLPAFVDTGADVTLVPSSIADGLLNVSGAVVIVGVGGDRYRALRYAARLEIDGRHEVLEVVGFGSEAIAGRDLLNRWRLILDGPRGLIDVS